MTLTKRLHRLLCWLGWHHWETTPGVGRVCWRCDLAEDEDGCRFRLDCDDEGDVPDD